MSLTALGSAKNSLIRMLGGGPTGNVAVAVSGRVAVGGPKERMVLAHLLVRANTTVSLDALVESVWAGEPPRSADRTMRSYVARLRKALPRSASRLRW